MTRSQSPRQRRLKIAALALVSVLAAASAGDALAQKPDEPDGPSGPLYYPIRPNPGDPDPVLPGALGPQKVNQRQYVDPRKLPWQSAKVDPTKVDMYYAEPGRPNIAGFWRPLPGPSPYYYVDGAASPTKGTVLKQFEFPYRPEWQAALNLRYHGETINQPYGDPSASCLPQGVYHSYIGDGSPLEITQTPGRISVMVQRMKQVRRFWTNGQLHPADWKATSQGHSIGHWEGDTLVVDTVGVRPEFSLGYRMPHSSKVHFVERFRRLDAETLAIYINIEDPLALTTSVQTTLYYKLGPPNDHFDDDFCVENNRNTPDENLIVTVNTDPRPLYGFDLPKGANHEDAE